MSEFINYSKPVQTKGGTPVRILCIDADGDFPVIGLVDGFPHCWDKEGFPSHQTDDDSWELENAPPLEKFYINISEDGSYQSGIQGLTYTPTTMAQLIVDPESKTIRVQGFNETKISIIGEVGAQADMKRGVATSEGDLMSGYFKTLTGRSGSIDLNSVELVDGDNAE